MRALFTGIALGLGLVVIFVAAGNGGDHSGDVVRAEQWAKDVCQTVGTWEGALKGVRKELQKSSYGARNSDGASGDFVEGTVGLRVATDRAYIATRQTLRRGIRRAGIPDAPQGAQASAALRVWAALTEQNLRAAHALLKHDPAGASIASEAYEALTVPASALAESVAQGRATVQAVRASDPALDQAFDRSSACRRLEGRVS
jgi:hypothetical protein